MSEALVPSYRVAREPSAIPWRILGIAAGVMALVAAMAGGFYLWKSMAARSVPVIEAPPGDFRVRPSDAGGLRVPNQSELILERPGQRGQTAAQAGRPAALTPEAERPDLNRLRQQVAPPPQPAPATAPAPQAAAPAPAPAQAAPVQAAPAAAPPRPVAPPNTGRVQVQLGALTSEEAARSEWERLQRRAPELLAGRSPVISRLERGEGQAPLFRLRTSGLPDQDAAAQFCEQLRARGANCMPVR
jgi:hypothetical protein